MAGMSSRSRIVIFLVSTPLAVLLVVGGLLGAARPTAQQGLPHLRVFEDVVSLIIGSYVEDVNVDKVFDGAMRGLSDGLDASSAYLTPSEVKAIDANAPAPAGETGLVISRQFYLRIVGVRDGSPAQRAGLQSGDFIRAINDIPSRSLSTYAGTRLLAGAPGTKVSLLVIRGNAAEPHTVELTREVPGTTLVTSRRLPSGEQYVRVASFAAGTASALKAEIPASATRVVVDLRATADGTPADGIAAARLFLKSGVIATLAARNASNVVTSATEGDGALTMPVVLLVSNGTGNAAEVFAAALNGQKRAKLVGEPTAGIAGVQHLVRLADGHGLWLTYARYMQADGTTPIHERGIRPDVAVDTPSVGFGEVPPATDAVLTKALEELSK